MDSDKQEPPAPRASRIKGTLFDYFGQHWRGELPLATAFWINFIALALVRATLPDIAAGSLGRVGLRGYAVIQLALWALAYAIFLWWVVGVFRSTKIHVRSGGSKFGAACGWLGLILAVGGNVFFDGRHSIPKALEEVSIARGDERISRLVLELLPSGSEVELTGGLPAGCAAQFSELLHKAPAVKVVHINNSGGRIHEALEIARIVKARAMTTYVSLHCESAATLIFLAGRERCVANGAKVGFHSASFPGMANGELSQTNNAARKAMMAARVDATFIRRALDTPASKMWYPSVEELVRAGVATNVTHGERFGISQTVAQKLRQKGLAGLAPYFEKLRKSAPDVYAEVDSVYRAGVAAGLSEGDIGARARAIITAKTKASIPAASDEALRHLMGFWLLTLGKYKDTQAEEIVNLFGPSTVGGKGINMNPGRVFKDYPADEEITVLAEVITSASDGVRPVDEATAERDLAVVTRILTNDAPDAPVAIASIPKTPAEYRLKANGVWSFYEIIRREIPPSRQANLLRHLLSEEADKLGDQAARAPAIATTEAESLPQPAAFGRSSPQATNPKRSASAEVVVSNKQLPPAPENRISATPKPRATTLDVPGPTNRATDLPAGWKEINVRTERKTKEYFTVGSTKNEVLALQGTPSSFTDTYFTYGSSQVMFRNGHVSTWNSGFPELKAKLEFTAPATRRDYFTVGSTKDEVLALQGTPSSFTDTYFTYGSSQVMFRNGHVSTWNSGFPELKAKLEFTAPATRRDYFSVGSTKDEVLALQGTPSSFTDTYFAYGSSQVFFKNGRVSSWSSGFPELKAKLGDAR